MSTHSLKITQVKESKLSAFSTLENISFGKHHSDHLLKAEFKNGKWENPEIVPYENLSIAPSTSALHYGQAIFEGMKAFKNKTNDSVGIFCIEDHFRRMNRSAVRLNMPELTREIFVDGMKALIKLDKKWVPDFDGHSLYIRPFMFATDTFLGVRPSSSYLFMIICSPASSYYSRPLSVLVENTYARATNGGVGAVKAAGNYAASLYPTSLANQQGFDQVLWTSSADHATIQEVGTMNIFFVFEDKVITPSLQSKTILDGITRKSVIKLLQEKKVNVLEEDISIHYILDMYKTGALKEIFGTGTAVVINSVNKLRYQEEIIDLSHSSHTLSDRVKKELTDIRYGLSEDNHGWMSWIN